jgi:hypothetical protein
MKGGCKNTIVSLLPVVILFASCGAGGAPASQTGFASANPGTGFTAGGSKVLLLQAAYKDRGYQSESFAQSYTVLPAAFNDISTACLACHGTYEELQARTANFVDGNGDVVQPHAYLDMTKKNPHDSTNGIDCLLCHTAHALPAPSVPVSKPSLNYCYNCHHTQDLIACNFCHPE